METEMLKKEVVIPFLFDIWSVIQKVKLFEELKIAFIFFFFLLYFFSFSIFFCPAFSKE